MNNHNYFFFLEEIQKRKKKIYLNTSLIWHAVLIVYLYIKRNVNHKGPIIKTGILFLQVTLHGSRTLYMLFKYPQYACSSLMRSALPFPQRLTRSNLSLLLFYFIYLYFFVLLYIVHYSV